ncbi:MAG: tRNA (N(6)-L-threonylcarbamoyladenosine(37)-C(2))-methylthiotransferase MtaB [Alphaproteobacteria bacterium]|nr:tRNA (N(6)-L-threonylcarbamoyladenosine(37)-C(2))-methylthiotransferase MtaB [Alphaproteobacteria bacterium]
MAEIITFGCRLNACESDFIEEFASQLGISQDYVIINTCAVTAEAERQLRQKIRQLYRQNPEVKIILTGCASELNPDLYIQMDGVIGIISNGKKLSKVEYEIYGSDLIEQRNLLNKKVRGFLQIQNGCDNNCTYCVVRLTRGYAKSFAADDIIQQARYLIKKGYREIVLTGVNISSYGKDFGLDSSFSSLIKKLLKEISELKRLRLSSLDPADIDDELITLFANEERLMPHVHESIQSGDNMILKRMRRKHSREHVIDINLKLLSKRSDIVFGADMIAGFPTETDEMFENSRKLLIDANISLLHAFPYSKRPGTPAALMPQISKKISLERARILRKTSATLLHLSMQKYIGKCTKILAETEFVAKTDSFLPVVSSNPMIPGQEYNFKCKNIENDTLKGETYDVIA